MKRSLRLIVSLIALAMSVSTGIAQDTSGKLTGIITDPSGAAVPGAKLIARNVDTNGDTRAIANSVGSYGFQSLVPGKYKISCEVEGFRRSVITGVTVRAQDTTTLNITLSVGQINEVVTVEAAVSQVEIDNATLQSTLGAATLNSLPVLGRDVRAEVELIQPGAVVIGNLRGGSVSYNGARANTNSYKVDGGDVNNYFNGSQEENTTFTQPENIAEFSVITNANDAKYGNSSGAYINAIVKSGTNKLHGMGWTYLQNQGWAANNWESNRTDTPRPPGSQKWFGGNVGGPVFIPKLYDGRNKTFFFFSYEYTNPSQFTTNSSVIPTAAERAGDFTNSPFGCPSLNGVVTCQVPTSSFSPLAQAVLANNILPVPSANGTFAWNAVKQLKTNTYVGKIDQLIGSKHRLSFTITRNFQDPVSNDYGTCCGLPGTLPGLSSITNPHHLTNILVNWVYTINPNMLNILSVGGAHTQVTVEPNQLNSTVNWSNLGVDGVVPDNTAKATDVHVFVNSWGGPAQFAIFNGYYDNRTSDTTNISDDFTYIRGRHTIELGYNQRIQQQGKLGNYAGGGEVNYSPGNPGSTGNPFADFFLDIGGSFDQSSIENGLYNYPAYGAFAQDRWKINRRLTVTYGLRWDPALGYYEVNHKFSEYRAGQQSIVFPNAPTGLVFYGDKGVARSGFDTKWSDFNPRIGFAYDLLGNGKMAIRGAYGIFSDFLTAQGNLLDVLSPPWAINYASGTLQPGGYHVTQDPYFGATLFPYTPPTPGSAASFPPDPVIEGFDPNYNSGRIHQWNANFQVEPFKGWVLTAAYVGNRGTHLFSNDDINTPVFIPNQSTLLNEQARRPDQNFASIYWRSSEASSRHNALQLLANKSFSSGLAIFANYSYGSSTASCASDGGPNEPNVSSCRNLRDKAIDYGPSPSDIRHLFSASYTYQPPIFNKSNGHLKYILGGWIWGGVLHAQSGDPLTITSSAPFNAGSATANGNYIGGNIYGDHSSRIAQAQTWLNLGAFCIANQVFSNGACVTDPNVGVTKLALGNTGPGFARGPGRFNVDMTLEKRFMISEKAGSLGFRAAAFNVFNHTQLLDPSTSLDSPTTFGTITSAYPPRNVQLSLRYQF